MLSTILSALCAVAASNVAATAEPPRAIERVEAVFAQDAAAKPVGGFTAGIVDHGRLVWQKGYGSADPATRRTPDARTLYRIGSMTKQFTATLLLQAVSRGDVRLDDPVRRYVPELDRVQGIGPVLNTITLLSLATHRAGLTREPQADGFDEGPLSQWKARVIAALPVTKIAFPVNAEAHYSNIGYAILGLALERALHRPFVGLIRERITEPLGMPDTTFEPTAEQRSRLAVGYDVRSGEASDAASLADLSRGRGYKIPNGGLFSTVDDMAKFVAFEEGDGDQQVLPRALETANFARSYQMGDFRYGVGFIDKMTGGVRILGHDGVVPGYTTYAAFNPQRHVGVICLGSASDQCAGTAPKAFAALVTAR